MFHKLIFKHLSTFYFSKFFFRDLLTAIAYIIVYIGIAFVCISPFLVLGYSFDKIFQASFTAGIWGIIVLVAIIIYLLLIRTMNKHFHI